MVEALGAWGVRWVGELGEEDLDPHLLMWDMRRTIPIDTWPRSRTTLAFRLDGVAPKASRWWLVVADGEADMCDFDPGYDVTVTIETSLRTLTRDLARRRRLVTRLLDGSVTVSGSADARRAVPAWIGQSVSAAVPRPA